MAFEGSLAASFGVSFAMGALVFSIRSQEIAGMAWATRHDVRSSGSTAASRDPRIPILYLGFA